MKSNSTLSLYQIWECLITVTNAIVLNFHTVLRGTIPVSGLWILTVVENLSLEKKKKKQNWKELLLKLESSKQIDV